MTLKDVLGNEFKPGQMVQVNLSSPVIIAQVSEVHQPGVIGLGPNAMAADGVLILMHIIPLQVPANAQKVDGVVVLQQPTAARGGN